MNDFKLYILNIIGLVVNFSKIDLVLKIALSVVVLGYTLTKWYIMIKKSRT